MKVNALELVVIVLLGAVGCSGDDSPGSEDANTVVDGGERLDASVADTGAFDSGEAGSRPPDAAASDTGAADSGSNAGTVDFVAIYEPGSMWLSDAAARSMVDAVFNDFEGTILTGGPWDATVEVFLTDNNSANANVTFDGTFRTTVVAGQQVEVVPAWQKIVQGGADPNGRAGTDGRGAEFSVHFNVSTHADNPGLLRHEMMHGLGAVSAVPWFTITDTNVLSGVTPGERLQVALYDLPFVDLDGAPLFAEYSAADGTFRVQDYSIELTIAEWRDGDGGLFFRGVEAGGGTRDMSLLTGPRGGGGGELRLNEISEVMVAGVHPTWDTIEEPDRVFLRTMGYAIRRD